jgi:hypothetical protein
MLERGQRRRPCVEKAVRHRDHWDVARPAKRVNVKGSQRSGAAGSSPVANLGRDT